MDRYEFRSGIAELVREGRAVRRGMGGNIRAINALKASLISYSVNYVCRYSSSPLLREAQDCLSALEESINPIKLQKACSRARELYIEYVRNNPFEQNANIMFMALAMNGFFAIPSSNRFKIEEMLKNMFDSILDGFGSGGFSSKFPDLQIAEAAEKAMQEVLACTQLVLNIDLC